jgi:CO dehydrogenase maturation factor
MQPTIIAVCGKGGVGKTCVSALLVRYLCKLQHRRILAIDADPAVGLSLALGIKVYKTVDQIRERIISEMDRQNDFNHDEINAILDYELFDALEEKDNLSFFAIGRPETGGCFCRVNDLLKNAIQSLSEAFDYVVIDAEAGVEHIHRRVMENVTHLLLVSDMSVKSINVAGTIARLSAKSLNCRKTAVLFNLVEHAEEVDGLIADVGIPVIGAVPYERKIRAFDREGRSFFQLPNGEATMALEKAVNKLLPLASSRLPNRVS